MLSHPALLLLLSLSSLGSPCPVLSSCEKGRAEYYDSEPHQASTVCRLLNTRTLSLPAAASSPRNSGSVLPTHHPNTDNAPNLGQYLSLLYPNSPYPIKCTLRALKRIYAKSGRFYVNVYFVFNKQKIEIQYKMLGRAILCVYTLYV